MKEIFEKLDTICNNSIDMTDDVLANKLKEVYSLVSVDILFNHIKSNNIVKNRVVKYCKQHNIDLSEYNGPLPYRLYYIPVGDDNHTV